MRGGVVLRNAILKEPLPTGAAILMTGATPVAHRLTREKANVYGLRSQLTGMTEVGSPV